eukprot:37504-Chlamydomonas_euryale.AAC.9
MASREREALSRVQSPIPNSCLHGHAFVGRRGVSSAAPQTAHTRVNTGGRRARAPSWARSSPSPCTPEWGF